VARVGKYVVTGEVGRGTFVVGDETERSSGRITPEPTAHTLDLVCYRSPLQGLNEAVAAGLVQMGEGATLPPIHKYPPNAGFITHRTAGATWIARYGMQVTPEQIVLTGGAQQGRITWAEWLGEQYGRNAVQPARQPQMHGGTL